MRWEAGSILREIGKKNTKNGEELKNVGDTSIWLV